MNPEALETSRQLAELLAEKPSSQSKSTALVQRMPFEEYLKIKAVNVSSLKYMAVSPMEYRHAVETGFEDKPAFALGHAAHTAILEPRRFMSDYVVQPETRVNEKGKEVKFVRAGAHWGEFEEEHAGKRIITQSEYDAAWDIQECVRKHPAAARCLSRPGTFETVITWTHEGTGLPCKLRIDHLSDESIDDLKTAVDITPRGFARACYNFKYHWQASFYRDGVAAATGRSLPFNFIPVQKTRPHDCVVYTASNEMLQIGRAEYTEALYKVAECIEKKSWPGISDEVLELDLPPWAAAEDDDEIIVAEDTAA